jgi:hypothetical protein
MRRAECCCDSHNEGAETVVWSAENVFWFGPAATRYSARSGDMKRHILTVFGEKNLLTVSLKNYVLAVFKVNYVLTVLWKITFWPFCEKRIRSDSFSKKKITYNFSVYVRVPFLKHLHNPKTDHKGSLGEYRHNYCFFNLGTIWGGALTRRQGSYSPGKSA